MTEVNNVRQIAGQSKMFSANETGSKARNNAIENDGKRSGIFGLGKKQDFKNDGSITSNEREVLIDEFGMTKAQIKEMQKNPEMAQFLDELLHAEDGKVNVEEIKAARQAVIQRHLIGSDMQVNKEFADELANFGFDQSKIDAVLNGNREAKLAEQGYSDATVTVGIGANATQSQLKMIAGGTDEAPEILLYDKNDFEFTETEANAPSEPKMVLKPADESYKYYVSADGRTFKLNNGNLSEFKALPQGKMTLPNGEEVDVRFNQDNGRLGSLLDKIEIYSKDQMESSSNPQKVLIKDGDFYVDDDRVAYQLDGEGNIKHAGTAREKVTLDFMDDMGAEDQNVRIVEEEVDGKPVIKLYKEDDVIAKDSEEPAITLTKDKNGLFFWDVEGNGNKVHFELTTDENGNKVLKQTIPPRPAVKEAFDNAKTITMDETGSTQRFTAKKVWNTGVKASDFNEDGVPKKISIALPDAHGYGKNQRTQLRLIDAEKMIYQDGTRTRNFQLEIGDDGSIKLNQVDIDNAKTKNALDKATLAAQNRARANGLDGNEKKVVIDTSAKAQAIIKQMSRTSAAWETFTQIGTNNGMHTRWRGDGVSPAGGAFEALIGGDNGIEKYSQIKPCIDALLNRVPAEIRKTKEYKEAVAARDALANLGDVSLKGTARRGHTYHNLVSNLDQKLMKLAQTHLAGYIQGTSQGNNNYVVGARGKVKIYSENSRDKRMSDAVFEMNGHKFKLHQSEFFNWRDVDFQDMFEYKHDGTLDKLSTGYGNTVGDNRHGTIGIDTHLVKNLDGMKFRDLSTGKKYEVKVEGNTAYVINGSQKVKLEDILNGRANFPL